MVKNLAAMRETRVPSLGQEDPLEKGMAAHSKFSYWRIPWTKESGGLQSMGSQRVEHSWATNIFTFSLSWSAEGCWEILSDSHGLAHSRAGDPANHWLRSLGPGPEFILHRPTLTSAGMCHMASSVRNTAWEIWSSTQTRLSLIKEASGTSSVVKIARVLLFSTKL